jgi:hypothetical protein
MCNNFSVRCYDPKYLDLVTIQLQISIGIRFKLGLPITVRCDNVGAIFIQKNSSPGVRNQHTDTRYQLFVNILRMGSPKLYLCNRIIISKMCLILP